MWYYSFMPEVLPTEAMSAASSAVEFAQTVRKLHRTRGSGRGRSGSERGSARREQDIEAALERIRDAMRPLRSEIGRFPYGPQTTAAEQNREAIYEASAALQRERRKLWKMKEKKHALES